MLKKELVIKGLKIVYAVSPSFDVNRAVVFLPGWRSPVDLFCSIAGDVPNLLAINLPGWGGSEKPSTVWGLSEYAEFIGEFFKKMSLDNPILIGHSVGAAVAVEYLRHGGRAQRLIIIGGAIIRERGWRLQLIMGASKLFRFLTPFLRKSWRRALAGNLISPDYVQAGEMSGIYQRLIKEDRQEAFRGLNLPIALIWGADDQDTPLAYAERLKKIQNSANLEIITQAGHYCFLDQPQSFRAALNKFL